MGCDCALTSFNEYFTDEIERIGKQLADFPETFKDVWSDLANVQQGDIAEEALAAVAQGILADPSLAALADLVRSEVGAALGPAQMPQFESAIDELSRVRDTQEAVKVLASIVFIVAADTVFNTMNSLAKKISRLSALKIVTIGQIKAAISLAAAAAAAFEAAGVDTSDIRDLVLSAASDVASAEAFVATMSTQSRAGTEIRRVAILRTQAVLQSAIDKLSPASVDSALVQSGALAALLAASDPISVASGGMVLAGMYIKQLREQAKELESQNRKISAAILAFKVGVSKRQSSSMVNYQFSLLQEIQKRLSATRSGMTFAANYGSMQEIMTGTPNWITSIGVAKQMLENLPPEVRRQEDLNAGLLAAHTEAVRQLESITGTHISDGVEGSSDLVSALDYIVYQVENLFSQVQTGAIADNARYLSASSDVSGFPPLSFVSSELTLGSTRYHWVSGGAVVTGTTPPTVVPSIARLDESLIQASLVIDVMGAYLLVQPPENALIDTLLDLLKVLRMDRGRDLLAAGNISDFMDASPLNWSYLGTAIDCIQNGMAAALDAGQSEIYDQLDTLLEPMSAKMAAIQLRMQRESAFSLNTVLEKLELQIEQLDLAKETLLGLVDKVDC